MSILSQLFSRTNPNEEMQPLYKAIVAEGRQLAWYEKGDVPDTLDGRFDMIAAILSAVLIRLEEDKTVAQQSAWLTEIFVTDMDGQLRQIGIGDMIVGKHIGRMMSALGGRIGAYRGALKGDDDLKEALRRNLYRGEEVDAAALGYSSNRILAFFSRLQTLDTAAIVAGDISESRNGNQL